VNRWARIVWVLAVAATGGWVFSAWLGRGVVSDPTLARHTLVAFAALLALVLAHGWIATYLLLLSRALPRAAELGREEKRRLFDNRIRGVVSAVTSILAALALFAVSNALYPARLEARPHAWFALVSCVVLTAALGLEARSLSVVGRLCRQLDR